MRFSTLWWIASSMLTSSMFTSSMLAVGCSSDDSDGRSAGDGFLIGEDGLPGESGVGDQSCLGETLQAEPVGLDMYVMLDISGSMLDLLPASGLDTTQLTKWEAVRQSLESFVQASSESNIGIGLQYFPLSNEGVPPTCASNEECGPGGPCTNSICVSSGELDVPDDGAPPFDFVRVAGDTPRFCASDADCGGAGETCRTMIGECLFPPDTIPQNPNGAFLNVAQNPDTSQVSPLCGEPADCGGLPLSACEEVGVCSEQLFKCSYSIGCPPGAGECVPFPYSCVNQTTCDIARYAAPAVPISRAPEHGSELLASIAAQIPQGQTPTGPALTGALEHARLWASQNPNRQVVTVLATDGFPTVCAPLDVLDIGAVAAVANSGEQPVRTFVIGVFGSVDLGADGQRRLDGIARAGGTSRAIVVNTAGDVGADFLKALNQIRDTAVSCEFQIDSTLGLDFDRVNLRVTDAKGNTADLFNVGDVSACGDDAQGWYYVRDAVGNPTQISVCPSTCGTFMGEGVRADLQIGCATRIR